MRTKFKKLYHNSNMAKNCTVVCTNPVNLFTYRDTLHKLVPFFRSDLVGQDTQHF